MTEQALRALAVVSALSYLKTPYHWETWDCSKFAETVWQNAGIDVEAIIAVGEKTSTSGRRSDCILHGLLPPPPGYVVQPGDLVFYGDATTGAHHVVIVLGSEGNAIIGANGGGPPLGSEAEDAYVARMARQLAGVRIEDWRRGGMKYRSDVLGVRRMPIELSKLAAQP